jgi:thiamine biosynthesis protein ThiI
LIFRDMQLIYGFTSLDKGRNHERKSKMTVSEGKIVCLISGGIDSPVATWLMIRKGLTPIFVYFDNIPFTDESVRQRTIETVEKLSQKKPEKRVKLDIVPHGDHLAKFVSESQRNLTCVLCKRMMYRIAEKIAEKEDAEAIVTGEIIGEHASQTVRNLLIQSEALTKRVTILRPLAGMNKTEVEKIAREIGTFDISTKPASSCTGAPDKPRTRARIEEVRKAEKSLDIQGMVEKALRNMQTLEI